MGNFDQVMHSAAETCPIDSLTRKACQIADQLFDIRRLPLAWHQDAHLSEHLSNF